MDAPEQPVRFSLALGGGGARGLAHIGVLKVLAEEGLRPCAIAGTSIGAIVGALYAAGHTPDELEGLVDALQLRDLAGVTGLRMARGALLTADRIERGLKEMLPADFGGLSIPFAAIAADLVAGERIVLDSGDLPLAVRASMSLPILFEPVSLEGMLLVDGGIVDPMPVEAARALCDGPVFAVDVDPLLPAGADTGARRLRKPTIDPQAQPGVILVGTRSFDVMQNRLARGPLASAAVVISPDVGDYLMADFLEGSALVAAGEAAAHAALPQVRLALAQSERRRGPLGWLRGLLGV
jgi:NTE family protein